MIKLLTVRAGSHRDESWRPGRAAAAAAAPRRLRSRDASVRNADSLSNGDAAGGPGDSYSDAGGPPAAPAAAATAGDS